MLSLKVTGGQLFFVRLAAELRQRLGFSRLEPLEPCAVISESSENNDLLSLLLLSPTTAETPRGVVDDADALPVDARAGP